MQQRRGYTLLEVTIAAGIFSSVVLIFLESLISVTNTMRHHEAWESLKLNGPRAIEHVCRELTNAGWLVDIDRNMTDPSYVELLADSVDFDRHEARYYPYIVRQDVDSLPADGEYAAWIRPPEEVVDNTSLPADLPLLHRQPSDEIIYVKVRSPDLALASPAQPGGAMPPPFNQPAVPMAAYNAVYFAASERAKDVAIRDQLEAVYGDTYSQPRETFAMGPVSMTGGTDIVLYFETWDNSIDIYDRPGFPDRYSSPDPDKLREFSIFVRELEDGTRALVRRWRNGSGDTPSASQETVLARNVDRVVFSTYRTDPDLHVNQIRFELFLSRRLQNGELELHHVETTVGMRSTTDPQHADNLESWLGGGGAFNLD